MKPLIEICLESVESVIAAEKGGADRVELCSDLFEGGLTPTIGTVKTALKKSNIKINVMIRPRGGDFCYSDEEFEVMLEDVRALKDTGINGIVFGILTPEGDVDIVRSKELIELARPLPVTFHRAFDMTRDPYKSLEDLINLGVDRVLTSGQEATVPEGADLLEELVKIAGDRIIVMPGCGITERNFPKLQEKIKAKEYHIYLPKEISSKMVYHPGHIYMGGLLRQSEFTITHTSSQRVSQVMGLL
ncbi:copper homeostasis protein CutC [Bullifex sp.]|uniref:copper homeostasis protein CutC n=1 Tax=Bullifex sp. TaxID=2815808 RepID=UPI002A82E713|nr:copper homeostasis protein CutC [Bullifex sp.]MDD5974076.1 copper homeostasis protein CutC [Spirochaetales bacterium]MDY4066960.1 copper homeostasis protein CutC [Bullifex sp.]